ncbi:3502_t:CDS:1, partial [Funneliformis geosporum]
KVEAKISSVLISVLLNNNCNKSPIIPIEIFGSLIHNIGNLLASYAKFFNEELLANPLEFVN